MRRKYDFFKCFKFMNESNRGTLVDRLIIQASFTRQCFLGSSIRAMVQADNFRGGLGAVAA